MKILDCPLCGNNVISISSYILEEVDYLKIEGHVNMCHRDNLGKSNTVCAGAELFKNYDSVTSPEIFSSDEEIINSHNNLPYTEPIYGAIFD